LTEARFELAISRFLFIAKKLITHSAMHMSLALYQAELLRRICRYTCEYIPIYFF
jgi:hypothetical protein